ncbi:hypothetical protein PA8380_02070 [Pseudomonas aeruginosa]|nr:hypothetical protein PA8380_02070 [Pseudomonas aeruginosa]
MIPRWVHQNPGPGRGFSFSRVARAAFSAASNGENTSLSGIFFMPARHGFFVGSL